MILFKFNILPIRLISTKNLIGSQLLFFLFEENQMEKAKNKFEYKVEIYHHPNPEIRSYLTNTEISAHRVEIFERHVEKDWGHIVKELGIIGGHVVKELMAIQEVEEIHIKPKEVRIKKTDSSSWDKIEKKVVEILMRALRRKQIKVIKA